MENKNRNILKSKVSKDAFIIAYLKLWNGSIQLTDKEFELLTEHVKVYYDAMINGVKEPYISEIVFSAKQSKEIKDKLNISHQNWHNYKNKLLSKQVFVEIDGYITINQLLIPRTEITFEFEII